MSETIMTIDQIDNYQNILVLNLTIKSIINDYIRENHISKREYAKRVGISWIVLLGLLNGIITCDIMDFYDVVKIFHFHGVELELRIKLRDDNGGA